MVVESNFIPYQASKTPDVSRVLVLAPHPDDEVFGCGGALRLHVMAGTSVRVAIVTAGDAAGDSVVRLAESAAAAMIIGYPDPDCWMLPDRKVLYGEQLVRRIVDAINETSAQLLYAPSLWENHPDHRAVALASLEAIRRHGQCRVMFYEVNAPLRPNYIIDISSVIEIKRHAISCFVSQLNLQCYNRHVEALGVYRTFTLRSDVVAAEAFELYSADDIKNRGVNFLQSEYHRQNLALLIDMPEDCPLVSIMVRSSNRPTLDEALNSLAAQTWANIEVVVVNAVGAGHRRLPEWCGRFPLRFIDSEQPLNRCQAANVALKESRGEYLGFLDDDDTIDPDHIYNLASELKRATGDVVVYSGVRGLRRDDPEHREVSCFAVDKVDFARLIMGNCIPLHAVLFPSRFLASGLCFDETLALYEDWDFWLQMARRAVFIFVDKISANYYLGGASGVSPLSFDAALAQEASRVLWRKWLKLLSPRDVQTVSELFLKLEGAKISFAQAAGEKERRIVEMTQAAAEREARLATLTQAAAERDRLVQTVAQREAHIAALLASTSWRVSWPLRWGGHQIKRGRHLWRILPLLLRRGGGFAPMVVRGFRVFQREGWAGLRFRLISVQTAAGPFGVAGNFFDRNDYHEWRRRYDTISAASRSRMRAQVESLAVKPLISVIMPTYRANQEWLVAAIESVRNQIYPHFELCIADDASPDPQVREVLAGYAKRDPRIKVVFRPENGHISAASNSAIGLATGDWLALFDHDDLLPEHALFQMAKTINERPEARLIYSDEDRIDASGQRVSPYFKCDWNRSLFYSHNLITHLGVYHADLVREVGGFKTGIEGAQDYDLALRCVERLKDEQIVHIPRVLYHWRQHPGSTAQDADSKPYAMLNGRQAISDHLQRLGVPALVEHIGVGYRVRYELPDPAPKATIIIPTRNGLKLIRRCVKSILAKTVYPDYEVLIVDNNSDDRQTLRYLDEINDGVRVRVVRDPRPFNYSALNNAAVDLAGGEVVCLLNNDTEVISPDWLREMVSLAWQPGFGAVGARLWYPDDTLQHGGIILGIGGWAGHAHKGFPKGSTGYAARAMLLQEFSAVTGACLAIRRELYQSVGGLNERELTVACSDVDLCLRLRELGYRNAWTPYAELYHHESASRGYENTPKKRGRFLRERVYMQQRWGEFLLRDPAYNPNLTLDHEDFSLAWPPRVAERGVA